MSADCKSAPKRRDGSNPSLSTRKIIESDVMQYKYKLARKIIKRTFQMKRALIAIYEDEDYFITEFRNRVLKTNPDEFASNCQSVLNKMYDVLNTPNRFKNR